MALSKKSILWILVGALLAGSFSVLAATTRDISSYRGDQVEQYDHFTLLNASTTNATSTALEIAHAEKVMVYFTRNGSVGTTTFSIEISPDGTNWYDFNKLISNVTNTNSQELTRVGSSEFNDATSTVLYAMDIEHDAFHSLRCIAFYASTTIDGADSSTCEVSVRE